MFTRPTLSAIEILWVKQTPELLDHIKWNQEGKRYFSINYRLYYCPVNKIEGFFYKTSEKQSKSVQVI